MKRKHQNHATKQIKALSFSMAICCFTTVIMAATWTTLIMNHIVEAKTINFVTDLIRCASILVGTVMVVKLTKGKCLLKAIALAVAYIAILCLATLLLFNGKFNHVGVGLIAVILTAACSSLLSLIKKKRR